MILYDSRDRLCTYKIKKPHHEGFLKYIKNESCNDSE